VNGRALIAAPFFYGITQIMGKQEIIDIIRNRKPEIMAHYGVQRLGLFGSYAHEQHQLRFGSAGVFR
jgi:hypothetical protein